MSIDILVFLYGDRGKEGTETVTFDWMWIGVPHIQID